MTGVVQAEVISVGSAFIGIGLLAIFLVVAYFMYQFSRMFKQTADKEEVYEYAEIAAAEKTALKKGIDIEAERLKRDMYKKLAKKRTFRKELEREMIEQYFGKEKKE